MNTRTIDYDSNTVISEGILLIGEIFYEQNCNLDLLRPFYLSFWCSREGDTEIVGGVKVKTERLYHKARPFIMSPSLVSLLIEATAADFQNILICWKPRP